MSSSSAGFASPRTSKCPTNPSQKSQTYKVGGSRPPDEYDLWAEPIACTRVGELPHVLLVGERRPHGAGSPCMEDRSMRSIGQSLSRAWHCRSCSRRLPQRPSRSRSKSRRSRTSSRDPDRRDDLRGREAYHRARPRLQRHLHAPRHQDGKPIRPRKARARGHAARVPDRDVPVAKRAARTSRYTGLAARVRPHGADDLRSEACSSSSACASAFRMPAS